MSTKAHDNDTTTTEAVEPSLSLNIKRVRTHVRGGLTTYNFSGGGGSYVEPTSGAITSGQTVSAGGLPPGSIQSFSGRF